MKRGDFIFAAVVLAAFAMILFFIFTDNGDYEGSSLTEEEYRIMNLVTKAWFGDRMWFQFRIVEGDRILSSGSVARMYINPRSHLHNPFYTDLIFVHNEAESVDFPDNIIVAWPRRDSLAGGVGMGPSEAIVAGMNWAVNRTERDLLNDFGEFEGQLRRPVLTLEEFGLTYPITVEDLVDNWQRVCDLWDALHPNEREHIWGSALSAWHQ